MAELHFTGVKDVAFRNASVSVGEAGWKEDSAALTALPEPLVPRTHTRQPQ